MAWKTIAPSPGPQEHQGEMPAFQRNISRITAWKQCNRTKRTLSIASASPNSLGQKSSNFVFPLLSRILSISINNKLPFGCRQRKAEKGLAIFCWRQAWQNIFFIHYIKWHLKVQAKVSHSYFLQWQESMSHPNEENAKDGANIHRALSIP